MQEVATMRRLALVLVALAVFAAVGCGTVSITPDRLAAIKSVSVARTVTVPEQPHYHGPVAAWGQYAEGSTLYALFSRGALEARDQIKAYVAQEQIDVGAIARAEFLNGLRRDPRFASRIVDDADTRFELEVFIYGLASNGPFSTQFRTWLGLQARLVEPSGQILWQQRDAVFLNDAVPLAPYPAYFEDPATFRTGFAAAATVITQTLLKRM
jgi:hypothetical protein